MKKSTKIITTAVALALVVAAMVVGIYAATQATATITASVTWTATQGIEFIIDGAVSGGKTDATMTRVTVTSSTINDDAANLAGQLDTEFKDADKGTETDDGVNNPGAITYTYVISNTGTAGIKLELEGYPAEADESGTAGDASSHKPKVAWTVTNGGTYNADTKAYSGGSAVTYANAIAASGITVATGKAVKIVIQLSLNPGGTGTINADTGIAGFDAGVEFALSVA